MKYKKFIYYNLKGIRLLYKMFPGSIITYCVLQMLHGVSWVLQVVGMQCLFDKIAYGERSLYQLLESVLLLTVAYFFAQIMNGLVNCYGQILNRKYGKECKKILFRIVNRKEVISFENIEELNKIHKAIRGSEGVFWTSTTVIDIVFFYGFYFGAMSWYLFSLLPILSISTLVIFIPNVFAKLLHMKSFEELENEAAPIQRKMEYYEKCMIGKEYLKETRLLGCCSYFFRIYVQQLKTLCQLQFRIQLRKESINFIINVLTVLAYGVIIVILIYCVLNGNISVGAFTAVFASLREFYGFMDEVISERFAIAAENMGVVKNYLEFIDESADKIHTVRITKCDIQVENVSFAYPQQEKSERKFAVSNINLQIPWGQTVALVGENGSGKSTLCHLIAGLYVPTQGTISYGGVQIKDNDMTSGISAVFQKFCRYNMTMSENVGISDIRNESEERIIQCCESAEVNPEWTDGLDGMLGREFNGAELSGGQWQRIAIARGMFREKNLLVLDEPTAAIDALEENHLYEKFRDLCYDCTAIIVTHRLAAAQIADRILVMKSGRIVQDGSHEELISVEGEYRKMYELQSRWYQ